MIDDFIVDETRQPTTEPPKLDGLLFEIAINQNYAGKLADDATTAEWARFNDAFENRYSTVRDMIAEIQAGHAFTSPCDGRRKAENWSSSQHLATDHDGVGAAFGDLLQDEFILENAAFVYSTPSHSEDEPRSRVVYILEEAITDLERYSLAQLAIHWKFEGYADRACKDPARLFYGSPGCQVRYIGNVLTVAALDALIAEFQAAHEAERRARAERARSYNAPPEMAEVAEALKHIDPWQLSYDQWLSTLMAIHDAFGDGGLELADGWADGYPGEVARKWRGFTAGAGVTIATVYHYAQQHGWARPNPRLEIIHDSVKPSVNGHGPAAEPDGDVTDAETILKHSNMTDAGNAESFEALHGENVRYCHTRRKWLIWDGARWAIDATAHVNRLALETARRRYLASVDISDNDARLKLAKFATISENTTRIDNALKSATSLPSLRTTIHQWDANPWLVATRKGETVDLRTGTTKEARKSDYLTAAVGVTFDRSADCPRWTQFLNEVFAGDAELIRYVQRAIGYSLTGSTIEQKLFILHGNGANGKSTFLDVLSDLAGDFHAAAGFETFDASNRDNKRDDLAALRGKRLVTVIEADEDRRLAEARVKAVTGNDTIRCRFLYGEWFDYKPAYKIWLAVNHKPIIIGTDHGIWRRIALIPFLQTFAGSDIDPRLGQKLRAELPGIFNWAIHGAMEWHANGLGTCQIIESATAEYRSDSDLVGQWISDCCYLSPDAKMDRKAGYTSYKYWAEGEGMKPMTANSWGRRMGERPELTKKDKTYHGLGLRSNV